MTPNELTLWRERMGYSTRRACEALGCSREALARWERGDSRIPRYIELACEAVEKGMSKKEEN